MNVDNELLKHFTNNTPRVAPDRPQFKSPERTTMSGTPSPASPRFNTDAPPSEFSKINKPVAPEREKIAMPERMSPSQSPEMPTFAQKERAAAQTQVVDTSRSRDTHGDLLREIRDAIKDRPSSQKSGFQPVPMARGFQNREFAPLLKGIR